MLGGQALVIALATQFSVVLLVPFHLPPAGWIYRSYLLVRMLALLGLCTVLLARNGETWGSVGLYRPRRLRFFPAWVIGGYIAIASVVAVTAGLLVRLGHFPMPNAARALHVQGGLLEYLYWIAPVTWGAAAFGEEMLFRGFLLSPF